MSEDGAGHLAIFGGKPTFPKPLHVGVPNLGDRERLHSRIESILNRRVLTNRGQLVIEFEERVADIVGVRHCVAMSN